MWFFLPCGDKRRLRYFPAVTYFLIGLNVALFFSLRPLGRIIVEQKLGLLPIDPSIGSIITSMFVHTNPIHLVWNMLFLGLFGPYVEDALGHFEYGLFYLGSGFAAALLHILMVVNFMPAATGWPVVGASGAIAGVLGVFAVRYFKSRIRVFWWGSFTLSAMLALSIWFLEQLIGGLASIVALISEGSLHNFVLNLQRIGIGEGVAYWSHIGGMGFGMLMAYLLGMWRDSQEIEVNSEKCAGGENAGGYLRARLESEPQNPDLHAALGKVHAMNDEADLAIAFYHRSIELCMDAGDLDKAVAIFAELKHFYSNAGLDLRSEYRLACYLSESGCCEAAIGLLLKIASTYAGRLEAEVSLLKAGDMYLSALGNKEEALKCYERFLEEYPQSSWRQKAEKRRAEILSK